MKNKPNYKIQSAGQPKLYVLLCALTLASLAFASCNNKGKGDATTHNDTSSTVTKTVDTVAADSGTKQP